MSSVFYGSSSGCQTHWLVTGREHVTSSDRRMKEEKRTRETDGSSLGGPAVGGPWALDLGPGGPGGPGGVGARPWLPGSAPSA